MGKTYKDRKKYERKHESNIDGFREGKREQKRPRFHEQQELNEDFDPYELYDDLYEDTES